MAKEFKLNPVHEFYLFDGPDGIKFVAQRKP